MTFAKLVGLQELTEKFIPGDNFKEWILMSKGYVPLSPSLLQKYEQKIPLAYHVTNFENLEKLKKIQNQRKDLPTFTKGSSGISFGAASGAEIIVELEGKSSFIGPIDFFSQLDRNGIRWIDPQAKQFKSYDINNKFSVTIIKKMVDYMNKTYSVDTDRMHLLYSVDGLNGANKRKFIKVYMDEAKKLLNKNMMKIIHDTIEGTPNNFGFDNNEVLLHQFKIKGVRLISDTHNSDITKDMLINNAKDTIESLGLKYLGDMDRSDIQNIDVR